MKLFVPFNIRNKIINDDKKDIIDYDLKNHHQILSSYMKEKDIHNSFEKRKCDVLIKNHKVNFGINYDNFKKGINDTIKDIKYAIENPYKSLNCGFIINSYRFPVAPSVSKTSGKAYYKFNESSGNLINHATSGNGWTDGLGSSADGIAGASPNYSQTGKIGNAISFDGGYSTAADRFELGTSVSQNNYLHDGSDWSISWWLKLTATDQSEFQDIFAERNGDEGATVGLCIYLDDTSPHDHKLRISIGNGSSQLRNETSNSYIPKNTSTWYHYIVTHTGSTDTINVYRDNANNISNSTAFTPSVSNSANSLRLGGAGLNVYGLKGILDETSFFARVFSSDDRTNLYNSGSGLEL